MPFVTARLIKTFLPQTDVCRDGSGMRSEPERVVLDVVNGVAPSSKPPVRIFLGTEPAQYRAERVFIWSIEQYRDPTRVYEIYLMKELAGFDRRRWLTGFTNYRFAIPHFAGGVGRAIWNDVDQAYLADPAELFDADMQGHGFLAISPGARTDTAVMLIDCARMGSVWTLEAAQRKHKNSLIAKALAVPGLRGDLAPEWHARDEEYVPGRSKLLHWTILHTQPWRPLPQLFVYQRNPVGEVWHELKRSADRADYRVFTSARPSAQYKKLLAQLQAAPTPTRRPGEQGDHVERPLPMELRDLAAKSEAKTVLEYVLGAEDDGCRTAEGTVSHDVQLAITRYDPAAPSLSERPSERFDGVVCTQGLDFLPDEDVSWVVDELFGYARRFVYATVSDRALTRELPDGTRLKSRPRDRLWWYEHFEAVAARHPDVHWKLVLGTPRTIGHEPIHVREAGRCLGNPPTVWVLANGTPENASQSVALAEALGWPYDVKDVNANGSPAPPWPDIAIAEGGRTASIARSISQQTRGHTRLLQLDNKNGDVDEWFDAVITPAYYRLPPHPRRIETVTRLTRVTPDRLAERIGRVPDLFGDAPRPRVVLLAGDTTEAHRLDAERARRMGEEMRTFAEGGSVFAFTGCRMGVAATGALVTGLGESSHLHWWRPGDRDDDPYLAYLTAADVIVVAGESEAMLADAVATGKPVYIYPLPERQPSLTERLEAAVLARSQARPLNRRGTVRPQQGPEYLCARLIERGFVRPPRDLVALHQNLIRLGVAQPFGASIEGGRAGSALHEADEAANKVRTLLGLIDA